MMARQRLQQRGVAAMFTVMAFMAFALPATAAALSLTSTLAIDSRIKTQALDCQYGAQAGEEYARYKILNDATWLGTITDTTPAVLNINVNGCAVSSQVSQSSAMVANSGMTMSDIHYTIPTGHQIEIKVTVNQLSDQHMLVAYDTVDQPAAGHFPTPSGTVDYYLHNYPTPPVGDTVIQEPLPMDETAPTATTLYNYSTDRDNDPGRFIQVGGDMYNETQKFKYQNWQTTPFTSDFEIDGDITFDMWVAMNHFDPSWEGMFNMCLRDFDPSAPAGSQYTEIGCTSMVVDTTMWSEGGFTGVSGASSYDIVTTSGNSTLYTTISP